MNSQLIVLHNTINKLNTFNQALFATMLMLYKVLSNKKGTGYWPVPFYKT